MPEFRDTFAGILRNSTEYRIAGRNSQKKKVLYFKVRRCSEEAGPTLESPSIFRKKPRLWTSRCEPPNAGQGSVDHRRGSARPVPVSPRRRLLGENKN